MTPMSTTYTIKTRSQAKYAFVRVFPTGAVLKGYCYSIGDPQRARARKLNAVIVPILNGKVTVTA